jgi:1,4-dihydroxy-2-naphthoyl-CoA synthase
LRLTTTTQAETSFGGGFEVALSADIRIADDRAEIGIPSAKMGILLELEYIRRLVALVGPASASQMLFTGQRFTAERALRAGLVNEVVPTDTLEQHTYELAGAIRDAAPTSVRWAKRCIQAIVRDPTLQSYADWETERVSVSDSPEFREGVRAFVEKHAPASEASRGSGDESPAYRRSVPTGRTGGPRPSPVGIDEGRRGLQSTASGRTDFGLAPGGDGPDDV